MCPPFPSPSVYSTSRKDADRFSQPANSSTEIWQYACLEKGCVWGPAKKTSLSYTLFIDQVFCLVIDI